MRGVTPNLLDYERLISVSIHTPHAGCDATYDDIINNYLVFQSTHPMRGVTP